MKTIQRSVLIALGALTLAACGAGGGDTKSADEKASQEEAENRPVNSTGKQGKVTLTFGSTAGAALHLQDSSETATDTDTEASTDTDTDTDTDTATATDTATDTTTDTSIATATATTLSISTSIELTEARFSIAAIKMKPTKERSSSEDEKDAVVAEEEKTAAQEIDALEQEGEKGADESLDAKPKQAEEDGDLEQDDQAGEDKAEDGQDDEDKAEDDQDGHGGKHGNGDEADGDDEHKSFKERLIAKLKARKAAILAKLAELIAGEHGRLEHEAKNDRAVRWAGPYLYDAITGQMTGDLPAAELADGSYRRIEFKLRRNFQDLDGHVLVIKGNFTDGDSVTPFEITWNCAMNLRLRSDNPYEVAPGGDNKLAIVFDMSTWFDGIDLSAADVDADGTIRINRHSNRDLVRQMRKNIKTGLKFGKDSDGDGKLAETETVGAGEDTQDAVTEE